MKEGKLIMLVDDDKTSNFLNRKIIKNKYPDITIVDFTSVEEALSYLIIAANESKTVDTILLDINMPELDGWDFVQELREKKIINFRSILMLSSSIDENDMERIKTFPEINGFLTKPLKINDLAWFIEVG